MGTVIAPQPERVEAIDALRGLALLGVLLVNLLTEFRVSLFEQFIGGPSPGSGLDRFIAGMVAVTAEGKAICLFSLLFGVGLAMQFDRMAGTLRPHYWLGRRLVALLGFGLFHLVFVWNGDILTEYAIVGLIALPLIGKSSRVLGLTAAGLLVLYAAMPFFPFPVSLPDQAELEGHVQAADAIYATGSYADVWRFSVAELRYVLPLHTLILPRTLALFFLGAYLWRSWILQSARKHPSTIGVLSASLVLAGSVLNLSSRDALGVVLSQLAPVVLAVGYAGTVLFLTHYSGAERVLAVFAPIGRMAFTNYVSQSVIFCLLFFGYGLGLHGSGVASTFALGMSVYLVQLIWSAWWLEHFRFGPLEWCWRSLTYGKLQPMRRAVKRVLVTANVGRDGKE